MPGSSPCSASANASVTRLGSPLERLHLTSSHATRDRSALPSPPASARADVSSRPHRRLFDCASLSFSVTHESFQPGSRAVKSDGNRAARSTEHLRDFCIAVIVAVSKNEHLDHWRGELASRAPRRPLYK